MHLIMVSSDRKIFDKDAVVRQRQIWHGQIFDSVSIIIFAKRGFTNEDRLSENVNAYSTNSFSKFFYIRDAIKKIIEIAEMKKLSAANCFITSQDPFETGIVASRLSKRTGMPFLAQIHTDLHNDNFKKNYKNKVRLIISRWVLKSAKKIRVVSKRIADSLPEYKDKISVLPVFLDKESINNGLPQFDLRKKFALWNSIVLMVGRLEKEKAYEKALRTFSYIAKKIPKIGLVIVGEGREEAKLKRLARKLGIESYVAFEGMQNDVLSYYKGSDFFLHTSLFEGFGLALAEAALCGLPIVASDVGLVGDILVDNHSALVCKSIDEECFRHKLEMVINNNDLRTTLGFNAKQSMFDNLFSKEEYLKKYQSLFT